VSQHGEGSMKFGKEDYPALFCAADRRSAAAQRTYICLTGGILSLLVAGAALAAVSGLLDSCKSAFAITSAVLLAISLALSTYAKATAPERAWYGGRALAESVKSVAWRYMTGARPYPLTGDQSRVDAHFIADLQSILKERSHLAFTLGGEFIDKPQISEAMRALRASGLETRKAAYVCERISDQRRWYGNNARRNRSAKDSYFSVIWLTQLAALLSAIALVRRPDSTVRLTGLFTSLASALVAWLQVKQHQELAQSYAIAEWELGLIEEQARDVRSNEELSSYVTDAEKAISREHMLWIARRDRT
jgi:hypothetical protein